MSLEDLKFINVLVDSSIYNNVYELLTAAIDADLTAAENLLSDFQ